MTTSPEYLDKLSTGLDVILNSQANCLVMGRILTSDNGGIIPSRSSLLASSSFANDDEVIL